MNDSDKPGDKPGSGEPHEGTRKDARAADAAVSSSVKAEDSAQGAQARAGEAGATKAGEVVSSDAAGGSGASGQPQTIKIDADALNKALGGKLAGGKKGGLKPMVDPLTVGVVSERFWSLQHVVILGVVVVTLALGGGFVWAVTTPLAEGVLASGDVVVDTNRKTVQHLEGGIIKDIKVREGDEVEADQALLVLDSTQQESSLRAAESRYYTLLGQLNRLESELSGASSVAFAQDLLENPEDTLAQEVMTNQNSLFETRRRALQGQRDILFQRKTQYEKKLEGLQRLRDSRLRRLRYVSDELSTEEDLLKSGNTTSTRVFSLRRQQAELDGLVAETEAEIAETEVTIGETRLQILQLDRDTSSEVSDEIARVQSALSEHEEELRARRDVLRRTTVTSPRDGRVVNLRFFTVGGVVPPGSPILDIVPREDRLVVRGQLRTTDIDSVYLGMDVRVRLVAFQGVDIPELNGTLELISADAISSASPDSAQIPFSYYEVRAGVPQEELDRLPEGTHLVPGMPVEILLQAGERTTWNYLVGPVNSMFGRAFTES